MPIKLRIFILLGIVLAVAACEQYSISYEGEALIRSKERKLPDAKRFGTENYKEIAIEFRLSKMTINDLKFNGGLWIETFVCDKYSEKSRLLSAVYLPSEIKFETDRIDQFDDRIVFGVYDENLLLNLRKKAGNQKPLCSRLIYEYPWELNKSSNTVRLTPKKS